MASLYPHPDPRVRRARQEAHRHFDRLWREGNMTRKAAYRWLAGRLGVYEYKAHMGNMDDLHMLRRVVEVCDEVMGPLRTPPDEFPDDLEETWVTTRD